MKTWVAMLVAIALFAGCSWFTNHASIIFDCRLVAILAPPGVQPHRYYLCANDVKVFVPSGLFPRVPGPSEKTPL